MSWIPWVRLKLPAVFCKTVIRLKCVKARKKFILLFCFSVSINVYGVGAGRRVCRCTCYEGVRVWVSVWRSEDKPGCYAVDLI